MLAGKRDLTYSSKEVRYQKELREEMNETQKTLPLRIRGKGYMRLDPLHWESFGQGPLYSGKDYADQYV